MTKTDFFRIIFKILALYFTILAIFNWVPSNIAFILQPDFVVLLWVLGITAVTVLFFMFFFFKTDKIIEFLKLDKGYDDENIRIEKLDDRNIMKFALILIGLFLILDYVPVFLNHCYIAFKHSVSPKGLGDFLYETVDYFNWAVSGINILLGYLILTNYARISKWVFRKEKQKPT